MIRAFTSAAFNYAPKVRLLCESIRRYHPEWHITWAVPDEIPGDFALKGLPFNDVVTVSDLDIPKTRSWIFRHTLVELSTAIKPFVLKRLLDNPDTELVLYFDPDMVLFSRLDDLVAEMAAWNIGLTPHQTVPEPSLDGVMDNEMASLKYGVFNLGFIAVRPTQISRDFTTWWGDRLYRFCREGLAEGLWTDQKWINLAPAFFPGVGILRSDRYNVAAWNLATRVVTGDESSGYKVNGDPLGFYHFSGFDSGAHEVMALKYAMDREAVGRLVQWYRTVSADEREQPEVEWAYGRFSNGEEITREHRLIYRMREDLQAAYPDPFAVVEGQCYRNWFLWRARAEHPDVVRGESTPPDSEPVWARVLRVYRREGIEGLIRRLPKSRQNGTG